MMTNPMWVTQFTLMLGLYFTLYVSNDENVSEEERHNVKTWTSNVSRAMAFVIAICAVFDFQ